MELDQLVKIFGPTVGVAIFAVCYYFKPTTNGSNGNGKKYLTEEKHELICTNKIQGVQNEIALLRQSSELGFKSMDEKLDQLLGERN
jgi:hypothetical protein